MKLVLLLVTVALLGEPVWGAVKKVEFLADFEATVEENGKLLEVSFGLAGERFHATLLRNEHIVAPSYRLNVRRGSDDAILASSGFAAMDAKAYLGRGANSTRQRLTILNSGAEAVEVRGYMVLANGNKYILEPASEHAVGLRRSAEAGGMAAFALGDLDMSQSLLQDSLARYDWDTINPVALAAGTEPLTPPPASCPASRKRLGVGMVVNNELLTGRFGGSAATAQTEVLALVNVLSGIYAATTNIELQSTRIEVISGYGNQGTGWGGAGFNQAACPAISDALNSFSYWRGNDATIAADTNSKAYMLLTYCYIPVPGGGSITVGLAWRGTVCTTSAHLNGGGPAWFSSTGVTSYNPNSGFLITAHELGHVLGATDDTSAAGDGIMSYLNYRTEFSRNSQSQLCSTFSTTTRNCVSDGTPSGGCTGCPSSGSPCGTDTCGQSCGTCASGQTCNAQQQCEFICQPGSGCSGKNCGADSCGNANGCGTCSGGDTCNNGVCEVTTTSSTAEAILSSVNTERAYYGSPPVSWSSTLEACLASSVTCNNYGSVPSCGSHRSTGSKAVGPASDTVLTNMIADIMSQRAAFNCVTDAINPSTWAAYNYRLFQKDSANLEIACAQTNCDEASGLALFGVSTTWTHAYCVIAPLFYDGSTVTNCPSGLTDCVPSVTCASVNRNCGLIENDCGTTTDCGDCETGTCDSGVCTCLPATCDSLGVTEGIVSDTCGGELDCGPTESCTPRTAEEACAPDGLVCGEFDDLCGGRGLCGTCDGESTCHDGQCSPCRLACTWGECDPDSGTCLCPPGFTGTGAAACLPETTAVKCAGDSWVPHSDSFDVQFSETADFGTSPSSCPTLVIPTTTNVLEFPQEAQALQFKGFASSTLGDKVSVDITRLEGSRTFGVFMFGVFESDYSGYIYAAYDSSDNSLKQGLLREGQNPSYKKKWPKFRERSVPRLTSEWAVGETRTLSMEVTRVKGGRCDLTVRLADQSNYYVDWTFKNEKCGPFGDGTFGLLHDAEAVYSNFAIVTQQRVVLSVVGCPDAADLQARFSQLLGVPESQVQDLDVNCNRRQAGGTTAVSFTLSGGDLPASALASRLDTLVAAGTSGVSSSGAPGVGVTASPAVAAAPAGTASVSGSSAAAGASSGSSGLSGGAIAGIVLGSVAVAVLLIGTAVVARGYMVMNDKVPQEEQPREATARFSMAIAYGVPVMRPESAIQRQEAGKHQSVTGRV
eukprot:CAMPEP_0119119558 /NCGR_PEP_ID=MMETSP1310-20130426/997_1 /TAXON_ID=464262 /ORGANISM="Genus nov. species nov., Strain RCC2339" /LENGTH=1224 /DNA_ID=CAMNT_0007109003 /DNA_START=76 /DNA_END=3750 /DNA_ORIENTATION=+